MRGRVASFLEKMSHDHGATVVVAEEGGILSRIDLGICILQGAGMGDGWRLGACLCLTAVCGTLASCVRVPDLDPVAQALAVSTVVQRIKCDLLNAVETPLED